MLAIPEADRAQGECGACAGGTLAAAVQGGCRSWNVSYDIPYLVALIGAASAKANINPAAVFVAGIDDGADMGFALACAHPELITGVFSINGATPPTCAALTTSVDPVSVLSVSAAAAAASKPEPAPAALASAQAWASRMGCAAAPVNGTALTELRPGPFFNGADSADSDWSAGCAPGSAVRLISVASLPEQTTDSTFTASFVTDSLAWLFAHPRGGAPPPPPALSPPPVAAVLSGNSSARRHAPPPPPHPPLVNASAHPILARIFGEDPAVASPPSPPRALPPPSLLARRSALLAAAAAALLASPSLSLAAAPQALDEESAAAEAAMREVLSRQPVNSGSSVYGTPCGPAQLSFTLPAAWSVASTRTGVAEEGGWTCASWEGIDDPVLGLLAQSISLRCKPAPAGLLSFDQLGKQADVLPASAFGLQEALPELARADITRAGARRGDTPLAAGGKGEETAPAEGLLFWEWELAVPPPSCAYNTGCNSESLFLLSLTLFKGHLCVFALKLTDEKAYRSAAGALRAARASFTVADRPVSVERGAPAAVPAVIVASP